MSKALGHFLRFCSSVLLPKQCHLPSKYSWLDIGASPLGFADINLPQIWFFLSYLFKEIMFFFPYEGPFLTLNNFAFLKISLIVSFKIQEKTSFFVCDKKKGNLFLFFPKENNLRDCVMLIVKLFIYIVVIFLFLFLSSDSYLTNPDRNPRCEE